MQNEIHLLPWKDVGEQLLLVKLELLREEILQSREPNWPGLGRPSQAVHRP